MSHLPLDARKYIGGYVSPETMDKIEFVGLKRRWRFRIWIDDNGHDNIRFAYLSKAERDFRDLVFKP